MTKILDGRADYLHGPETTNGLAGPLADYSRTSDELQDFFKFLNFSPAPPYSAGSLLLGLECVKGP